MEQVFDPLRRKWVAATPEEEVRQWFIGVLQGPLAVPATVMMSEVGMSYGPAQTTLDGRTRYKRFRADIVAYDRAGKPLLLVECKRPEVDLDAYVLAQAQRYDSVLDVRYILLTNGSRTLLLHRQDGRFVFVERALTYTEMLNG